MTVKCTTVLMMDNLYETRSTSRILDSTDVIHAFYVPSQLEGTGVAIGAQNIYHEASGAFTGEMSAEMAKSVGCTHVLVGHSERRTLFGETDEVCNVKTRKIIDMGMTAVLCIGETKEEYEAGQVKKICARQLAGALAGIEATEMNKVIIAYEPVWAIGTGLTATPAIAQSVHAGIRDWVRENYGNAVANKIQIQYGGSVKPESVDELMQAPDIDGCLVGGASLNADQFGRIFNYDVAPEGPTRLWAEEVVACGNQLGESPVWSVERQMLYWVDAPSGSLYSWDLKSAPTKVNFGETLGCVALRSNNTLLLGLESGLHAYDPTTKALTFVSEFEAGLNTRPNDGRTDREGNFVIGSYNNAHRVDAQPIGGLWRLPANGGALEEMLDYKFRCSNCICFTKDGGTMFFCDTPTRRIYQFDYNPRTGPSNRRLLYELPSSMNGGPDGAQCDANGNLWAAISGAGQVIRITPRGEVDLTVELPVKQPTSVTFGGPGLNTLFITTRAENGRIDAGSLFACQLFDVAGVPEAEYVDRSPVKGDAVSANIGPVRPGRPGAASAKFCTQCGVAFDKPTARFCAQCGTARR